MLPDKSLSPTEALAVMPERALRKETNWNSILRTPDGTEIPCTVKDISATGARIGLPASHELPESFLLKVVGKDFLCRVKLAWRKGNFVGVHIEQFGKIPQKVMQETATPRPSSDPSYKAIGTRRSRSF